MLTQPNTSAPSSGLKLGELVDLAFQVLRDLMTNPETPASVRLKAALFILGKASAVHNPAQNGSSAVAQSPTTIRTNPETVSNNTDRQRHLVSVNRPDSGLTGEHHPNLDALCNISHNLTSQIAAATHRNPAAIQT